MTGYGLFRSGNMDYAFPLEQIRRIIQEAQLYLLPGLPAGVDFVLVHGSTLIPVLHAGDVTKCLKGAKSSSCFVLVDSEYGTLAFAAETNGRIVAEHKGSVFFPEVREVVWEMGTFSYQSRIYRILDVDVLAMEITQGDGELPDAFRCEEAQ